MSTAATLPEDQLLELLIQLQKTTPDQARAILSNQPQIAYALIGIMVKLDLVSLDALQTILAAYSAQTVQPTPVAPAVPDLSANGIPGFSGIPGLEPTPPSSMPIPSAIPPHILAAQQPASRYNTPPQYRDPSRTGTPQNISQTPPVSVPQHPYGLPIQQASVQQPYPGFANAQNAYAGYGAGGIPGLGVQQQQQQSAPLGGGVLEALQHIPEDQKAMIIRVISMTPDQIRALPSAERSSVVQLRATLGLPSPAD